jgi:hypothetical protein
LVPGLSIGFKSLEHEIIPKTKGIRFLKWDFLELSAVTIPANGEATIMTIRSLDTAQRAASGQQARDVEHVNPPGASGRSQPIALEGTKMKTLAEQLAALEAKRAASAARMETVLQKSLDEDRTTDAAEAEEVDTLAAEVEAIDQDLARLRKLETTKAIAAKPVIKAETAHEGSLARGGLTVWAQPAAKRIPPQDYVWRSLVCKLKAHFTKQSPYEVLKNEYGEDEPTRAVLNVITRSAVVPADTVTSGLGQTGCRDFRPDFFAALMPNSVYPALSSQVENSRLAVRASCRCRRGRAHRRLPAVSSPKEQLSRFAREHSRRSPSLRRKWPVSAFSPAISPSTARRQSRL